MKTNKKKSLGYILTSLSFAIPMCYILIYVNNSNLLGAIIAGTLFELTYLIGLTLITRDLEEENRKLKSSTK